MIFIAIAMNAICTSMWGVTEKIFASSYFHFLLTFDVKSTRKISRHFTKIIFTLTRCCWQFIQIMTSHQQLCEMEEKGLRNIWGEIKAINLLNIFAAFFQQTAPYHHFQPFSQLLTPPSPFSFILLNSHLLSSTHKNFSFAPSKYSRKSQKFFHFYYFTFQNYHTNGIDVLARITHTL